jgi:hypothetical protein
MPNRVPDINSSIYTDCNPENIIPAKKGAFFFRRDKNFYVNHEGDLGGTWHQLPYKTVILPRPNPSKLILYREFAEVWEKTIDGYYDQYKELLPKTGWEFYSNEDVFVPEFKRPFRWFFPVPSSSYDSVGSDQNKSYDENFYYLKSGSLWYRTPITLYNFPGVDTGENNDRYTKPPYVVAPRSLPVPPDSDHHNHVQSGDQTYDRDYFYIKPSKWKRSAMSVFDGSNMTMF